MNSSCLTKFDSGAPWHLVLVVERIGPDVFCRLHGGSEHLGALALAHWNGRRVHVESLSAGRHKEGPLASLVARQLCHAAQATVACIAGIHFEGVDKEQIEEIVEAARALSARAAGRLPVGP